MREHMQYLTNTTLIILAMTLQKYSCLKKPIFVSLFVYYLFICMHNPLLKFKYHYLRAHWNKITPAIVQLAVEMGQSSIETDELVYLLVHYMCMSTF